MKIALAQTKPISGDIEQNIDQHIALIHLAIEESPDIIIFSELSLTGYEPTRARSLQLTIDDPRLQAFQHLSDEHQLTIGVGAPIQTEEGLCIGMVIFQPHTRPELYTKKYIHADEEAFFVFGKGSDVLSDRGIALAICYELSILQHLEHAIEKGASIYLTSVAKTAGNIDKTFRRLAEIACESKLQVLMVNAVGAADGDFCDGRSAVWSAGGTLLAKMNDVNQGILVFETETEEAKIRYLN